MASAGAVGTAVILAAGMGTRLAGVVDDRPKPLLELGGRPLLEWSLRALRSRGVARAVVVAGYRAEALRAFAAGQPGVEVVVNPAYASTGSMASLVAGLRAAEGELLLVEGDLVYDPAALDALLGHAAPDVLLASGTTGAGDEVWIEAPAGRLVGMAKERVALGSAAGELVGILKLSEAGRRALIASCEAAAARDGHWRQSYDTVGLVECARRHPIAVHVEPALAWGEIDDAAHWRRIVEQIWPAVAPAYARLAGAQAARRRRTKPGSQARNRPTW